MSSILHNSVMSDKKLKHTQTQHHNPTFAKRSQHTRSHPPPYIMPWMDRICCTRNICYGLNGKKVILAHCRGKQARDQEVPGGLTTSTWCRFSPHGRWQYTSYSIPLVPRKGGMVWASVIYSPNFWRWNGSPLISELIIIILISTALTTQTIEWWYRFYPTVGDLASRAQDAALGISPDLNSLLIASFLPSSP